MHDILEGFGERPFMTRTIRELIFDGWTIAPYVKWVNETLCKPDKPISEDLCQDLIGLDDGKEKFSFFYGVCKSILINDNYNRLIVNRLI